jgi:glycerol-3-phosphate dehydrogenase (NAD(P)+)
VKNLPKIAWYMRNEDISHLKEFHHNPNHLSSVEFHTEQLQLTSGYHEAIEHADGIILRFHRPLDEN